MDCPSPETVGEVLYDLILYVFFINYFFKILKYNIISPTAVVDGLPGF